MRGQCEQVRAARVERRGLVHVLLQEGLELRRQPHRDVQIGIVPRLIGAELDEVARLGQARKPMADAA